VPGSHSKKIRKGYNPGGTVLDKIRQGYAYGGPTIEKKRIHLAGGGGYQTGNNASANTNSNSTNSDGDDPDGGNNDGGNAGGYNPHTPSGTSLGQQFAGQSMPGPGNMSGGGNDNESPAEKAARLKAREKLAMLAHGYVTTNFNLNDPNNPLAGYQFNATAAARANMSEDESYSAALAELGFNPDGTPVTTGIGTSEDLGFSTNLGFDSISDVATLANIGFDPNFGMSTEDLSLRDTLATSALSEMSLPERQAYAESVNATDDLSLGFGIKTPDVDSTKPSFTDKIKDMYNGVVDVVDKAGYESFKSDYTKRGIKAPTYSQYKAMTTDLGDVFGAVTDYAGKTYTGLQTNTTATLGDMSLKAGDLLSVNYGGLPSFSPTMNMIKGLGALANQSPSITNSYASYNFPSGFNVKDHVKKDKYGKPVVSFTSRIMGPFTKAPELADYNDLGEFAKDMQAHQDKINARTNLEFNSISEVEGVTFKDNRIAASLTKSQYATAVARNMFTDPEMAAAYRSEAELNKAKEKEASKGGRPVNDDVANAANMGQDLTILTEYGTQIYNQLLSSGYDSGYAYRYALQLD
jgi:hypothetical protein|tara:strand:- start:25 stop:1761 length:1737 start_codon:yes stop_codon:yes gene_type:complete